MPFSQRTYLNAYYFIITVSFGILCVMCVKYKTIWYLSIINIIYKTVLSSIQKDRVPIYILNRKLTKF